MDIRYIHLLSVALSDSTPSLGMIPAPSSVYEFARRTTNKAHITLYVTRVDKDVVLVGKGLSSQRGAG